MRTSTIFAFCGFSVATAYLVTDPALMQTKPLTAKSMGIPRDKTAVKNTGCSGEAPMVSVEQVTGIAKSEVVDNTKIFSTLTKYDEAPNMETSVQLYGDIPSEATGQEVSNEVCVGQMGALMKRAAGWAVMSGVLKIRKLLRGKPSKDLVLYRKTVTDSSSLVCKRAEEAVLSEQTTSGGQVYSTCPAPAIATALTSTFEPDASSVDETAPDDDVNLPSAASVDGAGKEVSRERRQCGGRVGPFFERLVGRALDGVGGVVYKIHDWKRYRDVPARELIVYGTHNVDIKHRYLMCERGQERTVFTEVNKSIMGDMLPGSAAVSGEPHNVQKERFSDNAPLLNTVDEATYTADDELVFGNNTTHHSDVSVDMVEGGGLDGRVFCMHMGVDEGTALLG